MTAIEIPSRFGQLMLRPGPRLACLGLLILLLLVPLGMIETRVNERGQRRDEAAAEVAHSWGQAQSLAGPILRLPYTIHWREKEEERSRIGWLVLPPQRLDVDARLDSEVRKRGIFEVPLYRAKLKLRGEFRLPDASDLGVAIGAIDFGRAEIMIGIAEPGALSADSKVLVDGQGLVLEPSAQSLGSQGVHALLRQGIAAERLAQGVEFEVELNLRGSSAFRLSPVARETTLSIASNWPHPSFSGQGLPQRSDISGEGFLAKWSVSHLGRGYPPVWLDGEVTRDQIDVATFGVELCVPVDPYRMAERITKYGALLLLLSFAVIWVMELLGGRPLHPVQYLLMGGSLCLFGLLQLALAEHLYVVLQAEDLAFLLGALALFAALTAVMWATRKVNWSSSAHWEVADATVE